MESTFPQEVYDWRTTPLLNSHLHPTHTPSTIRLAQSPHLHLLRAGLHPRRSKGEKERAKVGWRGRLKVVVG